MASHFREEAAGLCASVNILVFYIKYLLNWELESSHFLFCIVPIKLGEEETLGNEKKILKVFFFLLISAH